MSTISSSDDPDAVSSEGVPSTGDDPGSDRLACWICQQPLREEASVRWRGEPVHPGCLSE